VDAPVAVLEQKVRDMANLAVAGVDMVTLDLMNAAEVLVAMQAARNLILPIARRKPRPLGANMPPA
jgi:hypothetical protein